MNKRLKIALALAMIGGHMLVVWPCRFFYTSVMSGVPAAWGELRSEAAELGDVGRLLGYVVTGIDFLKRKRQRDYDERACRFRSRHHLRAPAPNATSDETTED